MSVTLRKSNVDYLIKLGVIEFREETADAAAGLYFNRQYLGSDAAVDLDGLIVMNELLSAQHGTVFRFWFNPEEAIYPWHGGIFRFRAPIVPPDSSAPQEEIDAFNAKKIPAERVTGKWLQEEPDVHVLDRDMPNLFCQLLTAYVELFDEEGFFSGAE